MSVYSMQNEYGYVNVYVEQNQTLTWLCLLGRLKGWLTL